MATLIAINLVLSFSIKFIDWRAHVGGLVAGILMGLAAEGIRNRSVRAVAFPVAAVVVLVVGGVLVAAHTQTLRELGGAGDELLSYGVALAEGAGAARPIRGAGVSAFATP